MTAVFFIFLVSARIHPETKWSEYGYSPFKVVREIGRETVPVPNLPWAFGGGGNCWTEWCTAGGVSPNRQASGRKMKC